MANVLQWCGSMKKTMPLMLVLVLGATTAMAKPKLLPEDSRVSVTESNSGVSTALGTSLVVLGSVGLAATVGMLLVSVMEAFMFLPLVLVTGHAPSMGFNSLLFLALVGGSALAIAGGLTILALRPAPTVKVKVREGPELAAHRRALSEARAAERLVDDRTDEAPRATEEEAPPMRAHTRGPLRPVTADE